MKQFFLQGFFNWFVCLNLMLWIAKQIEKQNCKAAKWIAKDALRELKKKKS
jgi:hypothetical protein